MAHGPWRPVTKTLQTLEMGHREIGMRRFWVAAGLGGQHWALEATQTKSRDKMTRIHHTLYLYYTIIFCQFLIDISYICHKAKQKLRLKVILIIK